MSVWAKLEPASTWHTRILGPVESCGDKVRAQLCRRGAAGGRWRRGPAPAVRPGHPLPDARRRHSGPPRGFRAGAAGEHGTSPRPDARDGTETGPGTVELPRGPPGAEPPAPAPPRILVTDVSAAGDAAGGCLEGPAGPQRAAAGPGEEDGEPAAKEASEDGSGGMGSCPVALDPMEKEWLQGAASGDLPVLSQLLQQEPSLATKKDFTSVSAGPGAPRNRGVLGSREPPSPAPQSELPGTGMAAVHGVAPSCPPSCPQLGSHLFLSHVGTCWAASVLLMVPGGLHPAAHRGAPRAPPDRGPARRALWGQAEPAGLQRAPAWALPAHRGRAARHRRRSPASGQARRRWGSAEDLTGPEEEEEERASAQHLAPPAAYRAVRKFSR
ncbi:collagen alpha-1(I) chain-like [Rhea pennata]|uniref:collagen alpha-1(I) chain-like n=1 Tax=Rhea pennata TaxID=8795 RepID=UPI002E26763F